MVFYKELIFKSNNYEYNLDINNKITLIEGDSATGKTLMLSRLQDKVNNRLIGDARKPIVIIQKTNIYDNIDYCLANYKNTLIIIDNFDEIAKNIPDIINQIDTKKNQYIIIARSSYPDLNIPIWCCSTLDTIDNKIKLSYYNEPLRSVMVK